MGKKSSYGAFVISITRLRDFPGILNYFVVIHSFNDNMRIGNSL